MSRVTRRGMVAVGVALSAAAAACYSPTVGNGKLACSATQTCPDGYQCASNGYCYESGAAVPPDAPTAVVATPGVRSAQVSWSAPASDGGNAITSYTVTAQPGGVTASSTSTSATLNGLSNETSYTFTVVATNAIGTSRASAPSAAITTFGLPGTPTGVVAASAPHGATLDWSPPAQDGGTPVTGYLVQASLNGGAYSSVSPSISGTHAQIGGLESGGSYTFVVAAVNAVGAGVYSSPSAAIVLENVPALPVISAPSQVTAGDTGLVASVTANSGESYAWTISGGEITGGGAAGVIAGGLDSITFNVTAAAGGTLSLTCTATNAIGSSAAATFSAAIFAAPAQPTVSLSAALVTVGDTGLTAQVTANPGMTYSWTLSSNATLTGSDLHGVTANGVNTITYSLNGGAVAGGQVQLAVVEVNGAQEASAPGTAAQGIVAAPVSPAITAPALVAAGATGIAASVPARSGMTYLWTLTGATFSFGSSAAGQNVGSTNTIQLDVTAASGGAVQLAVVETNQAQRQGAPGAATIQVGGALPNPLAIGVAFDNGQSFQSGATQYVTTGASAIQAQVPTVASATYAWQIVSGGAVAHAGETGASASFSFDVTGSAGSSVQLSCTVSVGASSVTGNQTVTLVAPPVAPVISLDASGAAEAITVGNSATHHAAITGSVSTSSYAWSQSPAGDLATLGTSGTSVSFTLGSGATAGATITIQAVETNAAGRVGSAGSATVTVVAAPVTPVISAAAAVTVGDTGLSATVPAHSGMTYTWTLSSNATLRSPDLHGVTAGGVNTLSYDLNGGAVAGGAVQLSAVETNAAAISSSAGTASQTIAALPVTPTLTPPTQLAAGETSAVASVPARANMTYQWTLTGASFSSGYTSAGVTASGTNTIQFDVTASGGGTVTIAVVEVNLAQKQSAPASASITVGALPNPLNISVALDNGTQFQSGATQYVTAGASGIQAQVQSVAGATYAWTIVSGGATAHPGETGTSQGFKFDVSGAVGTAIQLSCTVTLGGAHVTGNQTVTIVAAPVTPALSLDGNGASELISAGNSATHQAAVSAPVATSSYAWSANPSADLATLGASGSSVSFTLAGSVAAGASISIQAVETNAAGRSGSPGSATLTVIAAPQAPTIAPFTSPGAPAGATFSAFAPGATYQLAVETPHTGMTYVWTVGAVSCPGASSFCTDESGSAHNASTIQLTANGSINGGAAPAVGEHFAVSVAEVNAAHDSAASTPLNIAVIAAPQAPAIGVIDHFGQLLDGATHLYVVTEGQQANPYVDSVTGQSYAWSATNSFDGSSVLASGSSASGAAGTGPSAEPTNAIVVAAPVGSAPNQVQLNVTTWNAAAFTAATELDLTINYAPIAPVIHVEDLVDDVRTPQAITYGAAETGYFTVHTNAVNETNMAELCSVDANATLESQPDSTGNFAFDVSAAPTLLGGSSITTTLTCTETNDAGDSATGTLTIPLAPPLTVALTPANGATGVATSATLSALFSYEPDAATVLADPTCIGAGNITLTTAGNACVAFTLAQSGTNPALFTLTPQSPLALGQSYTLTLLASGGAGGIADLQGVPLGATTSSTFTARTVPDVSAVSVTPHLQSFDLSWTNPNDAALDHIKVTATPVSPESGVTTVVTASTTSLSGASSLTIGPLTPGELYTLKLQAAEDAAGTKLSPGVTEASQQLGPSGLAVDFLAGQTASGLGPSFSGAGAADGSGAASFSLTWDVNELYVGFAQSPASGSGNALRIDGDALWLGIDVDGSASGADVNGESSTATGGAVYVNDQIIWPFNADYVVELKFSGGALVANLRNVSKGTWTAIASPVAVNGALAELKVPVALLGGSAGNMRFAFAFLNAPSSGNATVIDIAPAAYAADPSDGHTPATDVLGKLASITNAIDPQGSAFTPAAIATSLSGSTRTPAAALVAVQLDASAAGFGATDVVRLQGSLPPLSYTLADSSYALADDGTRGSVNSSGDYTGVFNFGLFKAPNPSAATAAGRQELFFKFTDNGVAESKFPTVPPPASSSDRVWTLSGQNETIGAISGDNSTPDPIVFNAVYGLTHSFELDFNVTVTGGSTSDSEFVILGDQTEIGDWVPPFDGSGDVLAGVLASSNGGFQTAKVTFSDHDFVSGNGSCPQAQTSADPQGCPLSWKAVGFNGSNDYEGNGNHTLNDDVINKRQLTWTWSDSSIF